MPILMNVARAMGPMEIIGGIVLLIAAIGIVVIVTMQEPPKQNGGLSALTGGDSFYSKNQGRTSDAMIAKVAKILVVVFCIATIVVSAIASRAV